MPILYDKTQNSPRHRLVGNFFVGFGIKIFPYSCKKPIVCRGGRVCFCSSRYSNAKIDKAVEGADKRVDDIFFKNVNLTFLRLFSKTKSIFIQ